jgi:hypothetical protein
MTVEEFNFPLLILPLNRDFFIHKQRGPAKLPMACGREAVVHLITHIDLSPSKTVT